MRLLLDTHVFLWSVTGSERLSATARRQIAAAEAVYISAVSIWEIAIKSRLGKIEGDVESLEGAIDTSGFLALAITVRHASSVTKLPLHHTDPFDRLLIAQAFSEPLHLITADRAFKAYGGAITVVSPRR